MSAITVKHAELTRLFEVIGCPKASKWNRPRMRRRLPRIAKWIDDGGEVEEEVEGSELYLVDIAAAICKVLEDGEGDDMIEITENDDTDLGDVLGKDSDDDKVEQGEDTEEDDDDDDDDDDWDEDDDEDDDGDEKDGPALGSVTEDEDDDDEEDDDDDDDDDGEKETPPESEKKPPKARKQLSGPIGVRSTKGRTYYCGVALHELGLTDGLSEELLDRIEELMGETGQEKRSSTRGMAGHAWHILDGYLNGGDSSE